MVGGFDNEKSPIGQDVTQLPTVQRQARHQRPGTTEQLPTAMTRGFGGRYPGKSQQGQRYQDANRIDKSKARVNNLISH